MFIGLHGAQCAYDVLVDLDNSLRWNDWVFFSEPSIHVIMNRLNVKPNALGADTLRTFIIRYCGLIQELFPKESILIREVDWYVVCKRHFFTRVSINSLNFQKRQLKFENIKKFVYVYKGKQFLYEAKDLVQELLYLL